MLYVGDTNYLFKVSRQYSGKNQPDVHINNVHFVRNQAQGGSPLAAVALAMEQPVQSLTSGDLTITNSVFQDLAAKGGASSTGVKGGKGTKFPVFTGAGFVAGSNGSKGGSGGLPSIPLRTDDTGVLAFNNNLKALAPQGGKGGARGANETNGLNGHFNNQEKRQSGAKCKFVRPAAAAAAAAVAGAPAPGDWTQTSIRVAKAARVKFIRKII